VTEHKRCINVCMEQHNELGFESAHSTTSHAKIKRFNSRSRPDHSVEDAEIENLPLSARFKCISHDFFANRCV
jgi:hypothetical protein